MANNLSESDFKEGQKVRVLNNKITAVGTEGTVVRVWPGVAWPIYVSYPNCVDGGSPFHPSELEIIDNG